MKWNTGLLLYKKGTKQKGPVFSTGPFIHSGAGGGTRTRDPDLGKVVLYQLSYTRALFEQGQI